MAAIPTWLYGLIVVGGMGGYWYYTQGRHGKDYFRNKLGLDADEQLTPAYPLTGQYKIEGSLAGKVAMGAMGVEERGKFFMMGLTSKGRMMIAENEGNMLAELAGKPKVYLAENISAFNSKGEAAGTASGPAGKEKRVELVIEFKNGEPLPIMVGESVWAEMQKWFNQHGPKGS